MMMSPNSFLVSGSHSIKANKRCFILLKRKKKKNSTKYMRKRFKRLKVEMEEMSKQQQSIKEGQRQVRAKFKAIEDECEQLRQETKQIIRQSENNQIRLSLMFDILKAREQCDVAKAAQLTGLLREIVATGDSQNEESMY
ncbi:hypothetical protein DITRI_Ditri03aG0002900 [Diplodiscus trichospermus]